MSKIKKFSGLKVTKTSGGKDPIRLVSDFILNKGFDPEECLEETTSTARRWMLEVDDERSIEILLEDINKPQETTIYMGVNVATVPVKGLSDFLATVLEVADGLIGVKISLVGHFIVMSNSAGIANCTIDDLDWQFMLVMEQIPWFTNTLASELGIIEED